MAHAGGKEQGDGACRRERAKQSVGLRDGGWIVRFVDKPDWCCFSTELVCVWQVSVLKVLLLEDGCKISMMATPGEALLRSGEGVWWCRNTQCLCIRSLR